MIGYQIKYVSDVFLARKRPVDAGSSSVTERKIFLLGEYSKVLMQIFVSIALLLCAVIIFLFYSDIHLQMIASTIVGFILGYWLR